MKLNKCFTTVFDSTLKSHGFKRKGVLYYRINGEVLQGITVKMTNPYSICCAFLPYWMYDILWDFHRGFPIDKCEWAEELNYLPGEYYRQDDENAIDDVENKAKVIGYMRLLRRCLRRDGDEVTVNHYRTKLIEVLDKVDTLVF